MLSIITPNLNNAKYLEDNVKSIMLLNIPFEHIIVDGGSTDGSLDIISKYPHIKLLHQTEKSGMYGAIHQGFSEASGDYIAWINADDRMISSGYEAMYSDSIDKKYDYIYSDGNYFYTKEGINKFAKGRRFGKFFLKHGCIPTMQPSIIFSKYIYNTVGGLRYAKFKICGDLDLFVRIAQQKEAKFKYIHKLSATFIKRGDSLGDLNSEAGQREVTENNLPRPNLLVRILFFIYKFI